MSDSSERTRDQDHELRIGLLEERLLEANIVPQGSFRRPQGGGDPEAKWLDGSRLVVRAWNDDAFRRLLIERPDEALGGMGLSVSEGHKGNVALRVVENTPELHNVIVCTLCSCYPRALLGPPPRWYTSEEYRARVVRDPRSVLREFGLEIPQSRSVRVWDSTAETRYMVLPLKPAIPDLNEDQLLRLVTPEVLVGTREIAAQNS